MKEITFILVLFLCISFPGTLVYPLASIMSIPVEGADSILEKTLASSENLKTATGDVAPRILVEYADSIFTQTLEKSIELETLASEVSPRILVEYADSFFTVSLKRPPLIGKLLSSLTVSSSPLSVSLNETIAVSGNISPSLAGIALTLTYTKPDGTPLTRTVVTMSDGSYTDTFEPDQIGQWKVKASWTGDENYYSAESPLIYFEVTPIILTLTIKTHYKDIPIEVNGRRYVTDVNGKVEIGGLSSGFTVLVSAEPEVFNAEHSRYIFQGWQGVQDKNLTVTIIMSESKTIMATYKVQHYVKINTNPQSIPVPMDSQWVDENTELTLGPLPATVNFNQIEYAFQGWLIDNKFCTESSLQMVVNRPQNVVAVYYQSQNLKVSNTTSIRIVTNSSIMSVTQLENCFSITVEGDEGTSGILFILLPKNWLMQLGTTADRIMSIIDGKKASSIISTKGEDIQINISYNHSQHLIEIYYSSFDAEIKTISLFGLPITGVSIKIMWPDGRIFANQLSDTSGTASLRIPTSRLRVEASYWGIATSFILSPSSNLSELILIRLYLTTDTVIAYAGILILASTALYLRRGIIEKRRKFDYFVTQVAEKYKRPISASLLVNELKDPSFGLEEARKELNRFVKNQQGRKWVDIDGTEYVGIPSVWKEIPLLENRMLNRILEKGKPAGRAGLRVWSELTDNAFSEVLNSLERKGYVVYDKDLDQYRLRGASEPCLEEAKVEKPEKKEEKITPVEKIEVPSSVEEPKVAYQPSGISNESTIIEYYMFLVDFLRKFVSEKLEEYYGDDWWTQGVPSDDPHDPDNVRKKCFEQREEYIKEGKATSADPLINFADLKDLQRIIFCRDERGKNNWLNIFRTHYYKKSPGYLIGILKDLYDVRTAIAHHLRKISDEDVKEFQSLTLKILCVEEYRIRFRELIDRFEPNKVKR